MPQAGAGGCMPVGQTDPSAPRPPGAFQDAVRPWMETCFGPVAGVDVRERAHRFLEEALELSQACGCTGNEAMELVSYVFGRPAGGTPDETGGVMVTLAALCIGTGTDMAAEGDRELAKVWTKVDRIRAKRASKVAGSPLPGIYPEG